MDGEKRVAVMEGDTPDEAGPSRPQKAKQDTLVSGEPCLDEKTLFDVAKGIGCDWVALAVQLGITTTKVETIEKSIQNDVERQGLKMLVTWKHAQSTSVEEQITMLCTALKNIERADIAGLLPDTSHAQETAKSGPDHLKILQQLLVSYYEAHAGFIPELVTSSMSPALGVDKFCVPLDLHKSEKHTTRKDVKISGKTKSLNRPKTVPLDTWEDMYDKKKVKEKMVLLSGGAGFGKSTLCVTIANTWKNREGSKVAEFELLFLLKLSQFKTSCVIDAIFDQLLQHTDKLTKSDVKKVISDNEDKVAFLMDGLDEIPGNILESAEGVYTINDLLKNKVLLNSCVLVTTRPDMVPKVTKGYRGYATVETKGFAFENRDTFINKHFADNTSGKDLISWLKSHQSLQELSKNPIIVQMLCFLWLNRTDQSKPLPDKFTTVFTEFADLLVERRFSSLSGADRKQVMDKILKGSGKVALDGLLDGERLHFSPEDFSRDESVLKDGCQMGILQTETVPSGLKSVEVVTFLHKSHQEYCAAHYLISLLDRDEQSFRQFIDEIIALGHWKVEYVLRFCCGLSEGAAALILSYIDYDNVARLCLFESGSKSLASKLRPPSNIVCNSQQDLVALHFYLESGIKLKQTAFKITCDSCEDLQVLKNILECCKSDIGIMTIDCVLRDQGNTMLNTLQGTLQIAGGALQSIEVQIDRGSIYDAKCISDCISRFPEQLWTVSVDDISHYDTLDLVDKLKTCVLYGLHVFCVSHVADFGPLVIPSLKKVWLCSCGRHDDDVEDIVSLLSDGHGLTKIIIECNGLSLDSVKTLARHCQALSKMSYVSLISFDLDDDYDDNQENIKRSDGPFKCDSYEEVGQLAQTLLRGEIYSTSWIKISCTMSRRCRGEIEMLKLAVGSLNNRLRGQMELTVDVKRVVNVNCLPRFITSLSNQVRRFNLNTTDSV